MIWRKIFLYSFILVSHLTAKTFATEDQVGNNKPCTCYTLYRPVCGVNGKTYSNPCTARCAGTRQGSFKINIKENKTFSNCSHSNISQNSGLVSCTVVNVRRSPQPILYVRVREFWDLYVERTETPTTISAWRSAKTSQWERRGDALSRIQLFTVYII